MKQIVGLILLLLGLYLGYEGYQIYQDSAAEFNILGVEVDISDDSGVNASYMHFAGAVISLIAGVILLKR